MKKTFIHLLAIAVAATLASGCSTTKKQLAPPKLVAISDNPSGQVQAGSFVWHDLLTPNANAARRFYLELFDWKAELHGGYSVLRHNGKKIAGILQVESKDGHKKAGVWMPSVSVQDVDEAISLAHQNGGKKLKGPLDMPERGRAALISDPHGAHLIVLRANGGDPVNQPAGYGDWLWDEVWSYAPDKSAAFYQSVFGYDAIQEEEAYDILMNGDQWEAGIRHLQGEKASVRWVPVVRVADVHATITKARELGGTIWVAPGEGRASEDTALIADNTGALLIVQRWEEGSAGAAQ